jgi:pyruvate carboxylase
MRAAHELGIKTVSIYSQEDRFSLHRMKADESYLVGEGKGPSRPTSTSTDIVRVAHRGARRRRAPGLRLPLGEPEFAEACAAAGLIFVGPTPEIMRRLGNKVTARDLAVPRACR